MLAMGQGCPDREAQAASFWEEVLATAFPPVLPSLDRTQMRAEEV